MTQQIVNTFLICQIIIQTALYMTICRPLLSATVKPMYYLLDKCNINLFWMYKLFNIAMILCNIGISFLVRHLAGNGAVVGITNMTASVVLGLLMVVDVHIITRRRNYAK